jgi:hypothetical protein
MKWSKNYRPQLELDRPRHLATATGTVATARHPNSVRLTIIGVIACIAVSTMAVATAAHSAPERASLAASLHEHAKLHLVHHSHSELVESGSSSGTFNCPVQITVKLGNNSASLGYRMSCAGKGTFSGSGKASYYVAGSVARMNGHLTLTHGTGRYSHATARNLRFEGTMKRSNYELSVTVIGTWQGS